MKRTHLPYFCCILLSCLSICVHKTTAQSCTLRFNQTWLAITQSECLTRSRQGLANLQYTVSGQDSWWVAGYNQNDRGTIGVSCLTNGSQTQAYVSAANPSDQRAQELVRYLLGYISGQSTPPNNNPVLRPTKASFAPNEQIVIEFSGFPGYQTDWIAICPAGAAANQATQSQYLRGNRQGTVSFTGLPAGSYEVRGFFNWQTGGYNIMARSSFTVSGGSVQNPNVRAVNWETSARSLGLPVGTRAMCACPGGGACRNVWGTDIYTHDSSICTAAVHSGLINSANGGTVMIEVLGGQTAYKGSSRNGVGSVDWGNWDASFRFVR